MNRRYIKIGLIIVLGVLLGIVSSIGDKLPFGSPLFIIGGFLNTASFWSLSAFMIGANFKSRNNAIIAAISFLSLSVISYYIFGYFFGEGQHVPVITLAGTAFSWIIISIFIGSLCGLAGMTAKFTKNLKKRMIAIIIPMVIIISESIISILQLTPFVNQDSNNYVPLVILIILVVAACLIPFAIFKNKRVALYTMFLGLIVSVVGAILLIGISKM